MVKEIHLGFPGRAFERPMAEATANYPGGLAPTRSLNRELEEVSKTLSSAR